MARSRFLKAAESNATRVNDMPNQQLVGVKDGAYVRVPRKPVGSTLLQQLAARTWAEVTDGAGVVTCNGEEVKTAK